MIGPVSGTGRTMMASLQQAIQKGMPPDQAIQYVKSMATQGVAPLTDLYAMMNQFQRMKQQPVQAPQTPPTIRDQLNMAEQQQMAMQQGLGGMPAPAMEQAQFAGGGIVAFAEGGETEREMSTGEFLLPGAYENGELKPWAASIASVLRPKRSGTSVVREAQALASQGRTQEAMQLLAQNNIDPRQAFGESVPRAATPAPAPAPRPAAAQTSPVSALPTDINPFSQAGRAERQALNFMEGARSRPEVADVRKNLSSTAVSTAPRVTAVTPAAAAPAQLTREEMENQEYERIQAFRKREGLGGASEKMQQFLTDEGSKLDKQFGEDRMLAFAEAGFKMAAAASRPGATFLGALSEGAISGTQALRGLQKEMSANRRGLKESMLKMEEAKELRKEGDFKTAMQQAQQARAEMFQREELDKRYAMDERRLQAVIRGQDLDYGAATKRALTQGDGRSSSGAIAAIKMQVDGLDMDYENQQKMANDMTLPEQERQRARTMMGVIRKERDRLVSTATLSGASGGAENPYPNMSNEQLLAALSE
jgi:hypothetical protein